MTGTRGPLPKPTALKLIQGNPGKRSLNLADGVNPRVEIPSTPKHLGAAARKEWRRITPLLEELGLISGLDVAALSLYCQAYGRLVELETSFNGMVGLVQDKDKLTYADAVYRCSYAKAGKQGYVQQSVIVQLIRSHREEVNRYLAHFGLSPAARARVTPSNYVQPTLPGIDDAPSAIGFAKFGAGA